MSLRSASRAFARPPAPGGRGASSVLRVMAVSSERAVVEIEDVRVGGWPARRRAPVGCCRKGFRRRRRPGSSRRHHSRNPPRRGERPSFEQRLGSHRDPAQGMRGWWNSPRRRRRVPILRCGKFDRPWIGVFSDREVRKAGRPRPPRFGVTGQNGMSESSAGPDLLSCGSSALSSPWFGPLDRRSMRSPASVTP